MYNDNRPNRGIGDWVVLSILVGVWSLDKFGFSFKALFMSWGIICSGTLILWIIFALYDKFKGN